MNGAVRKIVAGLWVTGLVVLLTGALRYRIDRRPGVYQPATDAAVALRTLCSTTQPVKLWVTDLNAYSTANPGRWIVGHCDKPCLSAEEARKSAGDDAAGQLYAIASSKLGAGDWLLTQLRQDVESGRIATDEELERFNRPYATLWTSTLLLDASPGRIDSMLARYQSDLQLHTFKLKSVQLGAVGLLLAAWLACMLLNLMTRGYFALRLNLIAGTITALALVVLLGTT